MLASKETLGSCLVQAENDLLVLLNLALSKPEIRAVLELGKNQSFWLQKQDELQLKSHFARDAFPAFYSFALDYLHSINEANLLSQYLQLLAEEPYANFHAQTYLVNAVIDQSRKAQISEAISQQAHRIAQVAAESHQSAGYLLWAQLAFMLGQYYQDTDEELAELQYAQAYYSLVMAKGLEPGCPDSIVKKIKELTEFLRESEFDINYQQLTQRAHETSAPILDLINQPNPFKF